MNKVVKNIMVRAVKNRMAAGEDFEDVIKSYPKLAQKEIEEIKKGL